ncbi:MAG: OadG family protein [Chlorobi bacterium]|nr:OadG family protein [Chlorobiota bacterium]
MIPAFVDNETWTITILGWLIVFAALIFLVGIFLVVPRLILWSTKRALRKKSKYSNREIKDEELILSGEINAAIALALYLYFNEIHDEESNIITIKEVRRRYSPWNSKLYGMNNVNFPR